MQRLSKPLIFVIFLLVNLPAYSQAKSAIIADRVWLNANVHTQDEHQSIAAAIAIKDQRILAVGSNESMQTLMGPSTKVIKLQGESIIPGLIDSHIHSIEGAIAQEECSVDDEVLSLAQLSVFINNCAQQQVGKGWLQVINIHSSGLTLNKDDLDKILASRPLFLYSTDGHTAWVNSLALKQANISSKTLDPNNGRILHFDNGEANGVLLDGATVLASKFIPPLAMEKRLRALSTTLDSFYAAGITGFLEANSNQISVETFCLLNQKGLLKSHLTLALGSEGQDTETEFNRLNQLRLQAKNCGINADTIKLYADGVMEYPSQTAALLRPYLDEKGLATNNRGASYFETDRLKHFMALAVEHGFNVHFHAIGDGAVKQALDAFDYARSLENSKQLIYSISHLQLIDPQDYSRFSQLNVIASLQLLWAMPDEASVDAVLPYIGKERHSRLYPAQSLLKLGANIAGGSDWNVTSFNPFLAMAAAVSRSNFDEPERGTLNPKEALTVTEILTAYSKNAAKIITNDAEFGQLKAGMLADMVVLDRTLSNSMTAQALADTQVLETLIAGKSVYSLSRVIKP